MKESRRIDRDVFAEESSNLTNVLALLTKRIQYLIKNKPYPDINAYSVGWDYEERQDLQYKKECNSKVDEQIANLKEYEDSPYFARMDFRVSKEKAEDQVMYIGKKGLNIDSSQLVYDWRSPVGQRYYMKSMICFDYNGFDYSLKLRRSLEISHGTLKWYHDEYVQGDELFKEGVTDPFLVDALRAKRADHKLTDIIKTIQENQNAIINYPVRKSFIVQGCAGSGKTMILLHRLSQIIFNNPKSDLSKIKIITPNNNFNFHINDLYTELGLEKIQVNTIDDYYKQLVNLYSPNRVKSSVKVMPDSMVKSSIIDEVYSNQFYSTCKKRYAAFMDDVKRKFDVDRVHSLCKQQESEMAFDCTRQDRSLIRNYESLVKSILSVNSNSINELARERKKMNNAVEDKSKCLNEIAQLLGKSSVEKLRAEIDDAKLHYVNVCENYGLSREHSLEDDIVFSYQTLLKLHQQSFSNLSAVQEKMDSEVRKYADLLKANEMILGRSHFDENKYKIDQLRKKMENTPFFKIKTKHDLRVEVEILERNTREDLDKYNQVMTNAEASLKLISQLKEEVATYKKSILSEADLALTKETLTKVSSSIQKLELLEPQLSDLYKKQKKAEDEIERSSLRIRELNEIIVCDADVDWLKEKQLIAEGLEEDTVFEGTIGVELDLLFKRQSVDDVIKPKALFRYQLFLRIMFYSLWVGRVWKNDRFLNIDEGQDLSPSEYQILKSVNGQDTIFNIYGDINQRISTKGLYNWNDIEGLDQRFELREDYRNTEQITHFCNHELGYSFTPIGIQGKPVEYILFESLLKDISENTHRDDPIRRAVIFSSYDHPSVQSLVELGCCLGSIQSGRISLLSVEDAKGLEFDKVYVMEWNMSKNERYISYTRALQDLAVCRGFD